MVKKTGINVVAHQVKPPLRMLYPYSMHRLKPWMLHFGSKSLVMYLERQKKMAPVLRPLPPMWKTRMELLTTDIHLAQPYIYSKGCR